MRRVFKNHAILAVSKLFAWLGSEAMRLGRCTRGVAAIEFALAAPVVILVMLAILEFSMLMFVNTLTEGGLREASRVAITGFVPEGTTRLQYILDTIEDNMAGLVDMDKAEVTYLTYDSFSNIGEPEPYNDANSNGSYDIGESFTDVNNNAQWDADQGADGVGNSGSVVLYTFAVDWELMTPLISNLITENGTITLTSSIAVRNEPWLEN